MSQTIEVQGVVCERVHTGIETTTFGQRTPDFMPGVIEHKIAINIGGRHIVDAEFLRDMATPLPIGTKVTVRLAVWGVEVLPEPERRVQ